MHGAADDDLVPADTPLSEPAPHAAADIAASSSALRISQVLSDVEHRRDADADDDQPEPLHAAPVGEQVHGDGGGQPAEQRPGRPAAGSCR